MSRLLSIALVLAPTIAAAQPAGAQAESLFNNGRTLMAQHKYIEACASFEASEKLDPATTTVVNLADCREKAGQIASAWGLYLQAERELRALTDETAMKLRDTMKNRAAVLEPKLSKLMIRVSDAERTPGLEIIRDNDHIDAGAWNQPLPTDPGTYKISARAPGRREWITTVTVHDNGDSEVVDVPALGTTPSAPVAAVAAPDEAPAQSTDTSGEAPPLVTSRSHAVPLAVGGGSLAVGVTAIVLEMSARSSYSDAQRAANTTDQVDLWHRANTKRYFAEGFGVVAIGGAAAAVYLYMRERSQPDTQVTARNVHVLPAAAADGFGLVVGGAF